MSEERNLDIMIAHASSNLKRDVKKYVSTIKKKNNNVLNQLPLVKSLRCKIRHLEGSKNETFELRNQIIELQKEMAELKRHLPSHLFEAQPLQYPSHDLCYAPKCTLRKRPLLGCCDSRFNNEWMSFKEAKAIAQKMDVDQKKVWLNWGKLGSSFHANLPPFPHLFYKEKGWTTWWDFLDLEKTFNRVSLTVTEIPKEKKNLG